ncbi:transposase [Agrobacterium tumefaciens]|uniref:transposase n=1 Tax=Agrobacterium tumefaciens TaxID=358 RepID=UPI001F3B16E2|nr:transposase [Agrobacterium tumefaciens]
MKSRGPYRRHSTPFKLQLCQDIRNGVVGRRDAQRTYGVSANLIQLWLTQFDRGDTRDAFEYATAELLSATNYLEALHAQIQQATIGAVGQRNASSPNSLEYVGCRTSVMSLLRGQLQ